MKKIALLLTITVTFLAFKPGLDSVWKNCKSEVTCCKESCKPFNMNESSEKAPEKDGCTGNSCNPFLSCSISFLLTPIDLKNQVENPEISTEANFAYKHFIPALFATDFWQPPKLV